MVKDSQADKEFFKEVEQPRLETLKRLRDEILLVPQQPDEVTTNEVAKELGVSFKTAEYRLKKLVDEGLMITRKGPSRKGHYSRLYKWVETKE